MRVYQVDAFTRERFRGNPAGVVPDARGLAAGQMQAIARELNNPETAFVVEDSADGTAVRVRFFTPTVEVPVCGHASLATHYVRTLENGGHGRAARQRSAAGTWDVAVEGEGDDVTVWLVQEPVRLHDPLGSDDREALLRALGVAPDRRTVDLPIRPIDTGHAKVLVPVASSAALNRLAPDMRDLLAFQERTGWDGVQVFAVHGCPPGVHVESRMFAPAIGIPEDPVTGSGQGPLGAYLIVEGLAACWRGAGTESEIVSWQGRAVGRPGSARLRVECDRGGVPTRVRVGGQAVVVFRTEIEL